MLNYRMQAGDLIGQKLIGFRPMTTEEGEIIGWSVDDEPVWMLIFEDGTALLPSRDSEAFSPGTFFFAQTKKGELV